MLIISSARWSSCQSFFWASFAEDCLDHLILPLICVPTVYWLSSPEKEDFDLISQEECWSFRSNIAEDLETILHAKDRANLACFNDILPKDHVHQLFVTPPERMATLVSPAPLVFPAPYTSCLLLLLHQLLAAHTNTQKIISSAGYQALLRKICRKFDRSTDIHLRGKTDS